MAPEVRGSLAIALHQDGVRIVGAVKDGVVQDPTGFVEEVGVLGGWASVRLNLRHIVGRQTLQEWHHLGPVDADEFSVGQRLEGEVPLTDAHRTGIGNPQLVEITYVLPRREQEPRI